MAATIPETINKTSSWLVIHEKLIIIVLVLGLALYIVQKGYDYADKVATHKYQQAQTTLQTQTTKTDTALDEAKQTLASYEQALAISESQNAKLADIISKRNTTLTQQQTVDSNLPPDALVARWQSLINNQGVQSTNFKIAVNDSAALDTVQQLEKVPVLTQNLEDEQKSNDNLQTSLNNSNTLINQGKSVISNLQLELKDQQNECNTELSKVKADARKSKLKWFGAGYIAGLLTKAFF